jgi:hypothetical protein
MQAPGVLLQCPFPGHGHGQQQGVKWRMVEAFTHQTASGQHDAGLHLSEDRFQGSGCDMVADERQIVGMGTAGGALAQGLQPGPRQPLQGCQIGPLIGIGLQVVIHEHAATPLPGFLLQRQGDGDLQRCGHCQLPTGAQKGLGIIAPVLLVNVDGQQVTGVVLQQGVEAEGVVSGQMAVDRCIAEGPQLAVVVVNLQAMPWASRNPIKRAFSRRNRSRSGGLESSMGHALQS